MNKEREEEIRVGVFVCNCGTNIAGFLDCKEVMEYAKTLPNVVFTRENLYSCSEAGVSDIRNSILEHNLNRVVVAACTPRTHEPTFRATCEEAGVNAFCFEFVNIREQCSWVHRKDPEDATGKAKDLVRMGVARAALLEPKTPISADVTPSAVVIGGGIAGLTAALSIAERGFGVTVVEREKELGGLLNRLHTIYPLGKRASDIVKDTIRRARKHKRVKLLTGHECTDVRGYVGNYLVLAAPTGNGKERKLKAGVLIVASGANQLEPTQDLFGYDGKRVITLLELEERLSKKKLHSKNVVFIKCAGARSTERIYCSRICCMTSLKNAIHIKRQDPDSQVHVLYRDLMCTGVANEETLREAKRLGVRFVNYDAKEPPRLDGDVVRVSSPVLEQELAIPCDLAVLAAPLVPRTGADTLSRMLKVPLDEYGFFLEAHVKLRPLDFATDGIYVCGTARWPASVEETVQQAQGAAARASIHLTNGQVQVEPITSWLRDEDECRGCGLCAAVCPYGAIEMVDTESGRRARMIEVACKGCGTCAATCYKRDVEMNHYSNEQILAQIRSAFAK